jgi:type I restriction enzyme S subunit
MIGVEEKCLEYAIGLGRDNILQSAELGSVADIVMGQAPPSSACSEARIGLPFLQGNAEFGAKHPTAYQFCSDALRKAEVGDILISVRAPVGAVNVADQTYVIGRGLAAIHPVKLYSSFAWHTVRFWSTQLEKVAQGSTFTAIGRKELEKLQIIKFGEDIEKSISVVLDTLDAAIEKSEALIAKLKHVRAGMLHDLLTCGVDENGEILDPISNPSEFQDSIFGGIPKLWVMEKLGGRLSRCKGRIQTGPFGSQLHASEYMSQGIPVVMPQDIDGGSISEINIARISEIKAAELSRHQFQRRDLVFARRGDLGRCAVINQIEEGWLCGTGCLLMRFEPKELLPEWLSLSYRHDIGQRQIAARAVGTTMVNLNTDILNHLIFPFPPIAEQHAIVNMLDGMDSSIAGENENLEKLLSLKIGLSADLLTGQTRIPPNLELP